VISHSIKVNKKIITYEIKENSGTPFERHRSHSQLSTDCTLALIIAIHYMLMGTFFFTVEKHFVTRKNWRALISCKIKFGSLSQARQRVKGVLRSKGTLDRLRHVSSSYPMRVRTCTHVHERGAHIFAYTQLRE